MDIISALSAHGYAQLRNVESVEHALVLTESLGPLLPLNGVHIQKLIPREKEAAQSNSFSRQHGLSAFPLHTDTAFWTEPARFVVLFSSVISPTATRVLPAQDTLDLMAGARRSNPIFLRHTAEGAIYSHPWGDTTEFHALYDPCYMHPVNPAALDFQAASIRAGEHSRRLRWSGAMALVIDNWRVMHGRERCTDYNRVLYRFYRGTRK